jgi:5'-nucleotidase/UDP-sugar diphosphatase
MIYLAGKLFGTLRAVSLVERPRRACPVLTGWAGSFTPNACFVNRICYINLFRVKIPKVCFRVLFLFTLAISSAYGGQSELRILHVNDFHGFAEPYKPFGSNQEVGGVAYLASKAEELRKGKASLLLSAGDMIQGNNWTNLFEGESVIALMNEMRFDAMVVGNHEFDFGQEVLRKRISEANFPVLGTNVEGSDSLRPYVVKDLGGIKIGILGLVTEEVPAATHPKNVAGLQFLSAIDMAEKYVKELKSRTDIIIVLSHIGHAFDRTLAEKVKGIDVIVGGHSHTRVAKPVKLGDTVIVQAWEHGRTIGLLDLTLESGKIISFDGYLEEIKPSAGKEDQRILAIVEKYRQKMATVLNEKVAETEEDLDGERKSLRRRETNLGNFVADIMRNVSKADVAIINGGGIRASIKKGEIRVKEIYSALPFDNYIVAIKLLGRQIREALEHGISAVEEEEGRFPQVSGLAFTYSPSDKASSRVREILVAGRPIDLEKEYIVATNDFLAVGGDGYKAFGEAIKSSRDFSVIGGMVKGEKLIYSDSGRWLRDVVVEYIKEVKRIAPKIEGRILEVR